MIYFLILTYFILNALDVYTTYKIISTNKGHEANPVMRFVMTKIGLFPGLMVVKTISLSIIGFIITNNIISNGGLIALLSIMSAVYGYVVYNNWKILTS